MQAKMKKPSDEELFTLADAAFRSAARKVIERAEQTGTPVILWEDGKIVRLKVKDGKLVRKNSKRKKA